VKDLSWERVVNRKHQAKPAECESKIIAAASMPREIMPTDGSVAESGGHVAVFCAACSRWVDCHAGINPMTALQRHADLIH
jgi:hypothetical protein